MTEIEQTFYKKVTELRNLLLQIAIHVRDGYLNEQLMLPLIDSYKTSLSILISYHISKEDNLNLKVKPAITYHPHATGNFSWDKWPIELTDQFNQKVNSLLFTKLGINVEELLTKK